jgi:release factor glutamine methyltransferase
VSLISAGTLRRLTQPILFKYWFTRGTQRESTFRVDGFEIHVYPTVFHPKYFGSSLIFGRFVQNLNLQGKRFLDLGTGSGIIGLYAARCGAIVTSVDVNPEAVRCAANNADLAGFRVHCVVSDLFRDVEGEVFDVIAWNPPFFPQPPSTLAEAAVYAGSDHELLRRFADAARQYLAAGGVIYLIFSVDGGLDALETIFRDAGFAIKRVKSERWGLAETMVILEIMPS